MVVPAIVLLSLQVFILVIGKSFFHAESLQNELVIAEWRGILRYVILYHHEFKIYD
jgi:hypothetical protein